MMINASRVGAIILILFSSFFYFIAGSYPPQARLFPRALLLGILILSVALVARSYKFDIYKEKLVINQKFQVLVCAFMAAVYVISIQYIGYYIASAGFILLLPAFLRFKSKIVPVAVALIFPLTIYLVFEILLNIPVPGIGS